MATQEIPPMPPSADFDEWEHREAARKINAIFANYAYIQPVGDGMLRINFGQKLVDDEATYHSAVVISAANAVAIGELIYRYGMSLSPPVPPPPIVRTGTPPPEGTNG